MIAVALGPAARQAVTLGGAAVGRVDGAEPADQAIRDGALRDLIGRVPARAIGETGDAEAVIRGAAGIAQ
jgi:hypothetical protein